MNIGDTLYYIRDTSNFMSRQKLSMTDDSGNTWYRYDTPIRSFDLETHTVVGKISVTVEGDIDENEMIENSYHTDSGMNVYQSEIDCFSHPYWFTDEQTALNILAAKRAEYAE